MCLSHCNFVDHAIVRCWCRRVHRSRVDSISKNVMNETLHAPLQYGRILVDVWCPTVFRRIQQSGRLGFCRWMLSSRCRMQIQSLSCSIGQACSSMLPTLLPVTTTIQRRFIVTHGAPEGGPTMLSERFFLRVEALLGFYRLSDDFVAQDTCTLTAH